MADAQTVRSCRAGPWRQPLDVSAGACDVAQAWLVEGVRGPLALWAPPAPAGVLPPEPSPPPDTGAPDTWPPAGEGRCRRDGRPAVSGAAVSPPALPTVVPATSPGALLRVDPPGLSGRDPFWRAQRGGGAARA